MSAQLTATAAERTARALADILEGLEDREGMTRDEAAAAILGCTVGIVMAAGLSSTEVVGGAAAAAASVDNEDRS